MAVHSVGGCVCIIACTCVTGTRRRRRGASTTHEDRGSSYLVHAIQLESSRVESSRVETRRAEARRAELDSIRAATTFSLMKTLLRFPPVCNATLYDVACVNEPRLRATVRSHDHSVWHFNWILGVFFNWAPLMPRFHHVRIKLYHEWTPFAFEKLIVEVSLAGRSMFLFFFFFLKGISMFLGSVESTIRRTLGSRMASNHRRKYARYFLLRYY